MTAKEARELTEKSANINARMCEIYKKIDHEIELAAGSGHTSCYIGVDDHKETWDIIRIERDRIKNHYLKLGYGVEYLGYEGNSTTDEFVISW